MAPVLCDVWQIGCHTDKMADGKARKACEMFETCWECDKCCATWAPLCDTYLMLETSLPPCLCAAFVNYCICSHTLCPHHGKGNNCKGPKGQWWVTWVWGQTCWTRPHPICKTFGTFQCFCLAMFIYPYVYGHFDSPGDIVWFPTHNGEIVQTWLMISDFGTVIKRVLGAEMFLESFPKGPWRLPNVFLIPLHSVTLVPIDYSILLCYGILVLGGLQVFGCPFDYMCL